MKILFLSRLYWPHGGGVEKHVEKLSDQLIKRGDTVTIITEQYEQNLPEIDTYRGVKVYRVPYFALQSKMSLWTWMENHIELFDEADVVHVHDVFWWYWPIWFLRIMKPVYITFHGYEGSEPPTKRAIFWRKISEILCRGSICVGEFMEKWYFARPTKIIYGASDMSPAPLPKSASAVFYGRFDEDTGVLVYGAAVHKLQKHFTAQFYGSGSQEKQLKKIIGKSERISILPWLSDVKAALTKSRYALVSRYLSILEAMQVGRLVLAVYNNDIKRDYLLSHPMRDAMVIAADADELIYKFNKILQSPEEEKIMISRARDWAKRQTWNKLMGEYLDLWGK